MKVQPLVSILITSYNREKYIADAIESVLDSTYQNFEVIIVDDCSTDNTRSIIEQYRNDKRIKIYYNECNLKQFANRNKAASFANGKYIKYVDSDDLIYRYGIEIMVDAMELFPEAGFGTFSNLYQDVKPFPFLLSKEEAFRDFFKRGEGLGMGPIAVIFKKEAFDNVGGFQNFTLVGDTELMMRLALRFFMVKIGTCQFYWRVHTEQAANVTGSKEIFLVQNYLINKKTINDRSFPLTSDEIESLNIRNEKSIANSLVKKYFLKGDWETAKDIMQQTDFSRRKLLSYIIKKVLP